MFFCCTQLEGDASECSACSKADQDKQPSNQATKQALTQELMAYCGRYCENKDLQSHIKSHKKQGSRISDRRIARWTLEIAEVRAFVCA